MSVTLPIPASDAWNASILQRSTGYVITGATAAEMTIDNLVPGHNVTVHMYAWSSEDCTVVIGETTTTVGRRTWTHIRQTVTVDTDLTLRVLGSNHFHLHTLELTDHTDLSDIPRPAEVLSLQAHFPIRGVNGGRFDTTRWDRDAYTTGVPPRGIGVFNQSTWDTVKYQHPAAVNGWQDITRNVTAIQITRGVQSTGAIHAASVGTMSVQALNDLDPRALGLTHGTPVTLIHWPTRTPIFTGIITDQQITLEPHGSTHAYTTTLTISDAVARLASITRYGARASTPDGSDDWRNRVSRLMTSAPDVPFRIAAPSMVKVCATVWETSLANHLDALAASVGGSWHITRDGVVSITAASPSTAHEYTLTDARPTDLTRDTWSYTAADLAWRAAETISSVTLTNHASEYSDGEWRAADVSITQTLPAASAAWAGASARVDTTLTTGLADAARRLLRAGSDIPMPRALTLTPAHPKGPTNRSDLMARAATLDPLQSVRVESNGDAYPAVTTTITHTITPTTWRTVLNLAPNR